METDSQEHYKNVRSVENSPPLPLNIFLLVSGGHPLTSDLERKRDVSEITSTRTDQHLNQHAVHCQGTLKQQL